MTSLTSPSSSPKLSALKTLKDLQGFDETDSPFCFSSAKRKVFTEDEEGEDALPPPPPPLGNAVLTEDPSNAAVDNNGSFHSAAEPRTKNNSREDLDDAADSGIAPGAVPPPHHDHYDLKASPLPPAIQLSPSPTKTSPMTQHPPNISVNDGKVFHALSPPIGCQPPPTLPTCGMDLLDVLPPASVEYQHPAAAAGASAPSVSEVAHQASSPAAGHTDGTPYLSTTRQAASGASTASSSRKPTPSSSSSAFLGNSSGVVELVGHCDTTPSSSCTSPANDPPLLAGAFSATRSLLSGTASILSFNQSCLQGSTTASGASFGNDSTVAVKGARSRGSSRASRSSPFNPHGDAYPAPASFRLPSVECLSPSNDDGDALSPVAKHSESPKALEPSGGGGASNEKLVKNSSESCYSNGSTDSRNPISPTAPRPPPSLSICEENATRSHSTTRTSSQQQNDMLDIVARDEDEDDEVGEETQQFRLRLHDDDVDDAQQHVEKSIDDEHDVHESAIFFEPSATFGSTGNSFGATTTTFVGASQSTGTPEPQHHQELFRGAADEDENDISTPIPLESTHCFPVSRRVVGTTGPLTTEGATDASDQTISSKATTTTNTGGNSPMDFQNISLSTASASCFGVVSDSRVFRGSFGRNSRHGSGVNLLRSLENASALGGIGSAAGFSLSPTSATPTAHAASSAHNPPKREDGEATVSSDTTTTATVSSSRDDIIKMMQTSSEGTDVKPPKWVRSTVGGANRALEEGDDEILTPLKAESGSPFPKPPPVAHDAAHLWEGYTSTKDLYCTQSQSSFDSVDDPHQQLLSYTSCAPSEVSSELQSPHQKPAGMTSSGFGASTTTSQHEHGSHQDVSNELIPIATNSEDYGEIHQTAPPALSGTTQVEDCDSSSSSSDDDDPLVITLAPMEALNSATSLNTSSGFPKDSPTTDGLAPSSGPRRSLNMSLGSIGGRMFSNSASPLPAPLPGDVSGGCSGRISRTERSNVKASKKMSIMMNGSTDSYASLFGKTPTDNGMDPSHRIQRTQDMRMGSSVTSTGGLSLRQQDRERIEWNHQMNKALRTHSGETLDEYDGPDAHATPLSLGTSPAVNNRPLLVPVHHQGGALASANSLGEFTGGGIFHSPIAPTLLADVRPVDSDCDSSDEDHMDDASGTIPSIHFFAKISSPACEGRAFVAPVPSTSSNHQSSSPRSHHNVPVPLPTSHTDGGVQRMGDLRGLRKAQSSSNLAGSSHDPASPIPKGNASGSMSSLFALKKNRRTKSFSTGGASSLPVTSSGTPVDTSSFGSRSGLPFGSTSSITAGFGAGHHPLNHQPPRSAPMPSLTRNVSTFSLSSVPSPSKHLLGDVSDSDGGGGGAIAIVGAVAGVDAPKWTLVEDDDSDVSSFDGGN